MSKFILKISVISFLCSSLISCNSVGNQKEQAQKSQDSTLIILRQDSIQNMQDSIEQEKYREETEATLKNNREEIVELRKNMGKGKKHPGSEKLMDSLEMKNERLEAQLKEFKEKGEKKWQAFKYDFNKELDSLGKSISRAAEKNMRKD